MVVGRMASGGVKLGSLVAAAAIIQSVVALWLGVSFGSGDPQASGVTADARVDVWRPTYQPGAFQGAVTDRMLVRFGQVWIRQENDGSFERFSVRVTDDVFERGLPSWSALHARDPVIETLDALGFSASWRCYSEHATGWPMLSFRSSRLEGCGSEDYVVGSMVIPGRSFSDGLERRVPLRPIWAGFLLNTVVYAAAGLILWALVGRLSWVRGWWRHRRGCCARCGYALAGGERCAECGWSGVGRGDGDDGGAGIGQ